MKCSQVEKLLSRSFDDRLSMDEQQRLQRHLSRCAGCQKIQREYQDMLQLLSSETASETKPYFLERLQPRLQDTRAYGPLSVWKHWGLRAIPLALVLILCFAAATLFFLPDPYEELSQSGILLRDQNPFAGSIPLLEEEQTDNPNMVLIFSSLEENDEVRRY